MTENKQSITASGSRHTFRRLQGPMRAIVGPYLFEIIMYFKAHKKWPKLSHPATFNDKICNRKLFDHDPRFPNVADKFTARMFVQDRIGRDILTQVYSCVDNAEAIKLDELPGSFVMKATHASGPDFIMLVPDKRQAKEPELRLLAKDYLTKNYGYCSNEWWYREIAPRVMTEEFLRDDKYLVPLDYKFYVFHGEVRLIQVDHGRFVEHTRTFYDRNWTLQDFTLAYRMGPFEPRPKPLAEMITVAETLGREFDFARVDLYCLNDDRILFGEITLAPEAGWGQFRPVRWDYLLGLDW